MMPTTPASLKAGVKEVTQTALGSRPVTYLCAPLRHERVPIFTLHRFAVPDIGVAGHDTHVLGSALEQLRKDRYNFVSVGQIAEAVRTGTRLPRRPVCFTIDDGYSDYGLVAAKVFHAYDCPATVFLTTGFVDRACWMWWDQIKKVLTEAERKQICLPLDDERLELRLSGERQRETLANAVSVKCTKVSDTARRDFIQRLALEAEVDIRPTPPAEYAALSWDEVRTAEHGGTEFAPHSVTHPILPFTSDEQCRDEIEGSWQRTQQEVARPVPVFSYPNGDHGMREVAVCRSAGLAGAVSTEFRYVRLPDAGCGDGLYSLPRFPYPDNVPSLRLTVSGITRVTMRLRRIMSAIVQ